MNNPKNMINMLPLANFEAFDKSNNFAFDQTEDEPKTNEFDALLSGLILPPTNILPLQKIDENVSASPENNSLGATENAGEFTTKIQPTVNFETLDKLPSSETPKTSPPETIQAAIKTPARENEEPNAPLKNLTRISELEKNESAIEANFSDKYPSPKSANLLSSPGKFPNKPIIKGEPQNVKLPPEIIAPPLISSPARFNNFIIKSSAPNNVNLSAFHNFLQTRGKVRNSTGGENPVAETNHLQNYLAALDVKNDADAPNAAEKTNEFIVGEATDKFVENSSSSTIEASQNKTNFSADLSKIFREVSNLNKEDSAETEANAQSNQTDLINSSTFENSSNFDANLSRRVEASKVFEQIEKPILQAVLASVETDKPQSLKLRLRPAELGAIEIRLEKTADGKIKIHFQTETESARHVLTESFEQLKNSLQNSGWQVERMEAAANADLSLSNGGKQQNGNQNERQNFAADQAKEQTNFGGDADASDDSQKQKPNRLLSVRA